MASNTHYFVFVIIITLIIFSSRTYAPWKKEPAIPPPGTVLSCRKWIQFYFKDNEYDGEDVSRNVVLARDRERKYDQSVSVWAAIYAHVVTVFPNQNYITPKVFCSNTNTTKKNMPYVPLRSAQGKCEEWIKFYTILDYDETSSMLDLYTNRHDYNYISIWPAIYGRFIQENMAKSSGSLMSSALFCQGIGIHEHPLQFMSFNDTIMSCQRWIALSGFSINLKKNKQRAEDFSPTYINYVNSWTERYIKHLLNREIETMTPYEFCNAHQQYESFSYFNLNMKVEGEEI